MTAKQQRFIEEYLIDLNATEAAVRAGYSATTAKEQGYQLLHKTSLSNEIARAMAERSRRTGVTIDRVVRELARIAFVDLPNLINFGSGNLLDNASTDDLAAVASIKVRQYTSVESESSTESEIKLYDKLKALDMLAKYLGMYSKVAGADEGDIENTGVIILPAIIEMETNEGGEQSQF